MKGKLGKAARTAKMLFARGGNAAGQTPRAAVVMLLMESFSAHESEVSVTVSSPD